MDPIKLDNFSKILLATAQINYQAASLHGVVEQQKLMGLRTEIGERIRQTDEVLQNAADSLTQIMVRMADYINNVDCICPLDVRVSRVPFEILVHGKDETEKSYEDNKADKGELTPTRNEIIVPDEDIFGVIMTPSGRIAYDALCAYIGAYNDGVSDKSLEKLASDFKKMQNIEIYTNKDGCLVAAHAGGQLSYQIKYKPQLHRYQPEYEREEDLDKADWTRKY